MCQRSGHRILFAPRLHLGDEIRHRIAPWGNRCAHGFVRADFVRSPIRAGVRRQLIGAYNREPAN
ncbi:MAG: hypothetical protein R3C26_23645 [Calditrichia bacterium]